ERCLDEATNYSKIRVTFGQPLAQRQAIQWMLADSAIDIYATRLMTYNTIWKFEQGEDIRSEISMVKVFATEMATRVADRAIQIHGGLGLTTDLPLERIYRGLRIMRIVEGASEVHRMVVARRLLA
ncbi:MAG TPA: acyl-CoA dehydrogenase, partial [Dehalococcoidia bacterium]|nr:acyl-CoA dehydrogenase [Dehalococcoidia bacterium]